MKIPKEIQKMADERGLNCISYIGKRKGKQAFMMGCLDESGEPIATGLPVIYLFDGKSIETVGGEEALKLL